MQRRLPRWSEVRPLAGMRPPALTTEAKVAAAASIRDLRLLARRRTPRPVFDYVDGAAETETSLRRARRAFRDVEFQPAVLRDVADVSLERQVLGVPTSMPVILAPTGFTRMMHTAGETAVARAAAAHDVVYTLSTMGTTTPEGVARAAPDLRRWFQLYVWQDRDATEALVERARTAGYEALMLTVDTAVGGARLRDVRNGLTIPPRLTPTSLLNMALHPRWWGDLLTTEPLEFATLSSFDGTVAELIDAMFDPTVTFDAISWLRERWDGPLVIKGIQTPDDAREVVERGADALVLSNHGGRQLDRAPTPMLQVTDVTAAVGDRAEIYLDGGVLDGADVVAAIAAGARAVLVGRAYLYGLMAGGEAGIRRVLELLRTDMTRTLQLMGVTDVDDLTPAHVRLPGPP
ncbi:alpha-hydroxy acid oxidase [Salsipaludibacter albus]|uniref:alpha-hydroxy acid oxidase n=1 Tax=Salsipaludibacter albus TaxID=2849650 RepID=UPI001EE4311C